MKKNCGTCGKIRTLYIVGGFDEYQNCLKCCREYHRENKHMCDDTWEEFKRRQMRKVE